jgi:hypothetical protein
MALELKYPPMNCSESCTVCGTATELTDRQPVDAQYEVLFFKCPVCSKSAQTVARYLFSAIVVDPTIRAGGPDVINIAH